MPYYFGGFQFYCEVRSVRRMKEREKPVRTELRAVQCCGAGGYRTPRGSDRPPLAGAAPARIGARGGAPLPL